MVFDCRGNADPHYQFTTGREPDCRSLPKRQNRADHYARGQTCGSCQCHRTFAGDAKSSAYECAVTRTHYGRFATFWLGKHIQMVSILSLIHISEPTRLLS